ncbi:MAG: GatB/YqeY domain-containing protein [Patescibacteria group bacterium]
MSLSQQLTADYIEAMKNKEQIKKEILNYIVAQIKYKKIELQKDPSDADVIQIIKKEIKAREESLEYLNK